MAKQIVQQDFSYKLEELIKKYSQVREQTELICQNLTIEDQCLQSMPDASPAKWHRAHTSWFFETFILRKFYKNYKPLNEEYNFLFNSYYNTIGKQYHRPNRGLISRPGVLEVGEYRKYIDKHMIELLYSLKNDEIISLLEIGLNHEQQHQELIIADIKHALSFNPLAPKYNNFKPCQVKVLPIKFDEYEEGVYEIGNSGQGFCYDNEMPRHKKYINRFSIADRLITNAEYLQFIQDGGYQNPEYWLSDGWSFIQENEINMPLYWQEEGKYYQSYTLGGMQPVSLSAPICHVSYYEADAFASWAGARLPREEEWELAASKQQIKGGFLDLDTLQPSAEFESKQFFGNVWQWTASPYVAYPGFKKAKGAVGEYNGKFMSSQMVLRGGSCVTPKGHVRVSYRNFFYPSARWQFSGIRLAKDL